ncbi:response regulator transcription factor [Brevundimonas sp. NPDC092305]|uniref:response regulator transcription factor n=1 Tax=Brevundimonas sp. NPDC092305 TaxID=3363957 RepID=UPI003807DCB3
MFDTLPSRSAAARPAPPTLSPEAPVALFLGEAASQARMERACEDANLAIAHAETLPEAIRHLRGGRVAVVLLGGLAGGQVDFSACHELSRLRAAPVMVLADRDNPTDRILALELGADDWAPADCCDREMAARLKAVLRRGEHQPPAMGVEEVGVCGWRLNRATGEGRHEDGARTILSRAELLLLNLFVRNAGRVLTRADLRAAFGDEYAADERGMTVSVFRLRRKLERGDEIIRTIRSVGYVMDAAVVRL